MEFVTIELDFRRIMCLNSYKIWFLVCIMSCCLIIFGYKSIQNKRHEINELDEHTIILSNEIEKLNAQITKNANLQQQLIIVEQELLIMEKNKFLQVDDSWLKIIADLAANSGVSLGNVVVQKSKKELICTIIPLKIVLHGTFMQVQTFLRKLCNMDKIILFDSLIIKANKDCNERLNVSLKLKFLTSVEYMSE